MIDAAHAAGGLVVLDAYQAAGIVPIDVRALGIDALVAGTNKWPCNTEQDCDRLLAELATLR